MSATTSVSRRIARVTTAPPFAPGFAGPGHSASLVVDPAEFEAHDPFIVLADDKLDLAAGAHVGGEHPHAGFEIATFLVEGSVIDRDEGVLHTGDLLWTRAGRGIIHNEQVTTEGQTRILQLWRALPEAERWSEPWFETVSREQVPVRTERGATVMVYAGRSGDVEAPARRHWPMTLLDVRIERGASIELDLPSEYAGFLYVLEGDVSVADDETVLRAGQVGWLDRPTGERSSTLRVASTEGARVVLYAGPPIGEPLVFHGPFVGGTRQDLMRVSRDYMDGRFLRMSELQELASPDGVLTRRRGDAEEAFLW
jgi:quercetin 2,3-dioxygenase